MSTFNNNVSSYEGRILEENQELRDALKWCVKAFERYYPEVGHVGSCSPPATPCDGMCMESYYFHQELERIEQLIKTEL